MTKRYLCLCILFSCFVPAQAVLAQESIDGFHHIAGEQPVTSAPGEQFGAVPTDKISLVNLAPVLLPYFNNGPVFGVPGTVTGSFWKRTQLTDDWGGNRTELAKQGFFFDMYSTTVYQNVTAGGLETGGSFTQNIQYSVNIDSARAGLWSGGLFHFTVQSRYGDSPSDTFTAGTFVPQYTGLVYPGPTFSNNTYPTEYYFVQALSKKVAVVAGKISTVFIPDQTLFASAYKYHFANFNFLKNPMTTNFYGSDSWAILGVYAPSKRVALAGGVLDPNSEANNFATNAFNHVNIYVMSIVSWTLHGRPGQFSPAFNWSNKPKTDLNMPYNQLTPAQVPQAIGALLGVAPATGLSTNYKNDSWFTIGNASQYLYVKDSPTVVAEKLRSGQLLRGVGVFGRFGFAPDDTNTNTRNASIAVFGYGLFEKRPYDSVGAGFYWDKISSAFKSDIAALTAGMRRANNEKGIEVFYDFALTPAVRIVPSYQHIWNPLTAQVAANQNSSDVFQLRLTFAW